MTKVAIKLTNETLRLLDEQREYPEQTYEEIISILINEYEAKIAGQNIKYDSIAKELDEGKGKRMTIEEFNVWSEKIRKKYKKQKKK